MNQRIRALLVCILLSTSFTPSVSAGNSDGIISNVMVDKSTVNAGESVTVTFSVLLSQTLTTPILFGAYIYGPIDENGDSWTDEGWSAPATLVSGTQVNGRWSATINIGTGAYTGSYMAAVSVQSKSFTRAASVPISISGTTPPIPTPPITGTISNFVADKSTVSAGESVTFTFDLALSATPPSPFESYMYVYISGPIDENGDSWIDEGWYAKPSLISGTQENGRWSATINIGAGAYTGSYVARLMSKMKLFTGSVSVPISISGTTPPIRIDPTYVFSNQVLSTPAIVRGNSVEATFHLTSNDSQLETPECIIDGGVGDWSDASLVLGQKLDGNWKCSVTVPSNTAPGTYDFHIVVIGRANNEKNEERVILPIKIVANAVELLGPSSNNAFITTTEISSTSEINADSVGGSLSHVASSAAVARVFISQGSGTITASVSGPGLIGFNSGSPLGRSISINRSSNSVTNLYLFADGVQGRSTISIMVSGQASTKIINFGNLGGVAPTSTPSPTPTPTPTLKPVPSPKPTESENPETKETPTPKASTTSPKPTPKPSTVSPTPKASTTSPKPTPKPSTVSPTPKKTSIPKLITLICIKGKITKRVTAIKPVCPAGYKTKK